MAAELELDPEQVVLRGTLVLPPAAQALARAELLAVKQELRELVQAAVAGHLARVQERMRGVPALDLVQLVEGAR